MAGHPQAHLWAALQRRFADQTKPSTSPDRLLRGLCVMPLDGQEEAAVWSLGYREVGSVLRSVSLSRDFQALAAMIEPDRPCYIAAYVGDVQQPGGPPPLAAGSGDWVLIAYVPSMCTSFEAKKLADNRAHLKAGLGADAFAAASMWCVSPEQVSLSNYMRTLEEGDAAGGGGGGAAAMRRDEQELAAAKIQGMVKRGQHNAGDAEGSGYADLGGGGGEALLHPDATEAVWEERIVGVRHAYVDSCARLVGALEELEQTLCTLTGDEYRHDEPLLHARAHISKHVVAASRAY